MKLREICEEMECILIQGDMDKEVTDIAYDSRKAVPGSVFVCITGTETDGHLYIRDAVEKGASAIIVEREEEAEMIPECITVIKVYSGRRALALISSVYFGHPERDLITVGITGTKGKTTTMYMIKSILDAAGERAGISGTIEIMTGSRKIYAYNTTPQSYELYKYMAEMVKSGCRYIIMEVSSQGIKMNRTEGIIFDYGVFTNISPDHIGPGEHEDFGEYLMCKSLLFRQCVTGVVNADDVYIDDILKEHTCSVITFSAEKKADITASDVRPFKENGRLGMEFEFSGLMKGPGKVNIPGRFSVYNALAAAAVCRSMGISETDVQKGLEEVHVKGRAEMVNISEDFTVIIDYAHNETSTRSILETLRSYRPSRIVAVFGCGGNRSRIRRYDIGRIAGELADLSVLTSDNPRFEKVSDINDDIKKTLNETGGDYLEIEDRKEAIAYAVTHAFPGDVIIMLGKGHEDYIETEGIRYHFSEHEAIEEIVKEIKSGERRMENGAKLI